MSEKTNIDVGKLGSEFGAMFRKLRPKVEETVSKPDYAPLYGKLEKSFKQQFGDRLSKKDMLDLLTYYLIMCPVHQAIYSL